MSWDVGVECLMVCGVRGRVLCGLRHGGGGIGDVRPRAFWAIDMAVLRGRGGWLGVCVRLGCVGVDARRIGIGLRFWPIEWGERLREWKGRWFVVHCGECNSCQL